MGVQKIFFLKNNHEWEKEIKKARVIIFILITRTKWDFLGRLILYNKKNQDHWILYEFSYS